MASKVGKKYDVAILGWWYGKNYGSILTYYGLNQAIEGLGFDVLMAHETLGYDGYRVVWPDDILSMQFAKRVGYSFTEQMHYSQLPILNDEVKTFVVGSDQLWNPLIGRVNDDLFLDFVGSRNRRVAYGTSFGNRGTSKFKPEFVEKHSVNLRMFDAISVREEYAINIAKDVFGVEARQVVDPVFLLSRDRYEALAEKATYKADGDYLAVFYLDPTPEKRDVALAIADKLGLQKLVIIPNPDRGREVSEKIFSGYRFSIMAEDSPENFLYTYQNSSYVVTDSFHGTAFATLFEKPFSSIYNKHRGVDRFTNLLTMLGFGDSRRIHETDTFRSIQENKNVTLNLSFEESNYRIDVERKASLRWLKAAISESSPSNRPLELLGTVKNIFFGTRPSSRRRGNVVERPSFTSSDAGWTIKVGKSATELKVAPGAAIVGNRVWCDLPFELERKTAYRLTINWKVRSASRSINLHIRNKETGKFVVIGSVPVNETSGFLHADSVEFVPREDGFSQFLLGAVHFTGHKGGADISSISVQKIVTDGTETSDKAAVSVSKASDMALKDSARYVRFTAQNMSDKQKLTTVHARLMFHAHAIEKGLSRSNFRPGFGKIAVPNLAKEMNAWVDEGRNTDDEFFKIAASVMKVYFSRHKAIKTDVSEFAKLFSVRVLELINESREEFGGVLGGSDVRELKPEAGGARNFLDVVYGRRSIRDFSSRPVDDEDIRRAVQIAMQAPSVCNRQAGRVHQFQDPAAIKAALDLQGGFTGYEMPPRLLLVTSDLSAFLFAAERNQPFVDGGLFMMSLLLGLEQVGLGSCCLNTAMNPERESSIRKLLNIPDNEVFISFVAVGHYDPSVLTPRSKRIATESVLVKH